MNWVKKYCLKFDGVLVHQQKFSIGKIISSGQNGDMLRFVQNTVFTK